LAKQRNESPTAHSDDPSLPGVLCFGPFAVDPNACRLSRAGVEIHLTPKAAAVLCLLLQRPNELITKDEFLETVWEGVFVREESLTQAISVIRQALGDAAQSPQYIQTVSGEGYRFIGEVSKLERGDAAAADVRRTAEPAGASKVGTAAPVSATASSRSPRSPWVLWKVLVPAVAMLAAVALIATLGSRAEAPDRSVDPSEIRSLTADGGMKRGARLSPDGTMVAFDWRAEGKEGRDIWVKPITLGADYLQVTDHPAPERGAVWSPDGMELAFLRIIDGRASIHIVPALGGQARKVIDIEGPASVNGRPGPALTWSRNGRYIAFSERPAADQPSHIVVVDMSGDQPGKTVLTTPPSETGAAGDAYPAFSPDGRQIAFARGEGVWGNWDVWVVDLEQAGDPRRPVTHERFTWLNNVVWSPDGTELFFVAGGGTYLDNLSTYRVSVDGGQLRHIEGLGSNDRVGNVAEGRMVFTRTTTDPRDVWAAPLGTGQTGGSQELIASVHHDLPNSFHPDGGITFMSDRSGEFQGWLANPDGSEPRQLTSVEQDVNFIRWSPDARFIAFDSGDSGNRDIWIQEVGTAWKHNLAEHPATDWWPTFSRDGQFVYFGSNRDGDLQIFKVPREGGEAVRVTENGGAWGMEAPDGFFYYAKADSVSGLVGQAEIWRLPMGGGEETLVIAGPLDWSNWDIAESGIYYASASGEGLRVYYKPFGSDESEFVYQEDGLFARVWMRVSPDEQMVVFGKNRPSSSELFLIENFR